MFIKKNRVKVAIRRPSQICGVSVIAYLKIIFQISTVAVGEASIIKILDSSVVLCLSPPTQSVKTAVEVY